MPKYSNWRQDLIEVIDEPTTETKAEKKVKETKVNNKVVINPTFKEAVAEMGGQILEVTEVDDKKGTDEDPQIKSKEKRAGMIKRQVLLKKLQAVRAGGGADITAGYEPEGDQLNELKKSTLGSYIKKASKDLANRSFDHGESEKRMYEPDKEDEKEAKKQASRQKGIDRAADKLAKERYEPEGEIIEGEGHGVSLRGLHNDRARLKHSEIGSDREKELQKRIKDKETQMQQVQSHRWNPKTKKLEKNLGSRPHVSPEAQRNEEVEVNEGVVGEIKKGVKRHKDAVQKKKIKNRKAVPYVALAAEHQPEGEIIEGIKGEDNETRKAAAAERRSGIKTRLSPSAGKQNLAKMLWDIRNAKENAKSRGQNESKEPTEKEIKAANEKKRMNALQIQKIVGEAAEQLTAQERAEIRKRKNAAALKARKQKATIRALAKTTHRAIGKFKKYDQDGDGKIKVIDAGYEPQGDQLDETLPLRSRITSVSRADMAKMELDDHKRALQKRVDQSTKNRGDLKKRDAGAMARDKMREKDSWYRREEVVLEKDLSAAERRALPNKDFVFPGKGEGPEGKQRGAYPINDKKHARAALAMAAAHASPEKEAKVKAAVKKKFPDIQQEGKILDERLGGRGYSRAAMRGSIHPPTQQNSGDREDSDRGAGNKAARRAGKKVEKKSPTYRAYVRNKEVSEGKIADALRKTIADMKAADRKAGLLPGGKDVVDLDVERERRRKKRVDEGKLDSIKATTYGMPHKEREELINKERKRLGLKPKPEKKVDEGVMNFIKSVGRKKKEERKPQKAMDAGAKAKRMLARKVHAKYVSGSEDLVPDDIREADNKAYEYVVAQLKKKYGDDAVLTKGQKPKPPTAAQKKAADAQREKIAKERAAEFKKDPSQGRYPPGYSNRGSD